MPTNPPTNSRIAVAMLAALFASAVLADDFTTINGKEYKGVTVNRVEPDGIVVKTNRGISKVYFIELPKEVQKRFHYDVPTAIREIPQTTSQSSGTPAQPKANAQGQTEIISALANRVDDKIKAVLKSAQMQKAQEAQDQEWQIAIVKNSELYKRGYAKQSTAVKITVSDAERDFADVASELRREESLPHGLIEQAGVESLDKHVTHLIDLMGALAHAKQRLFDLYALIMKDGE